MSGGSCALAVTRRLFREMLGNASKTNLTSTGLALRDKELSYLENTKTQTSKT